MFDPWIELRQQIIDAMNKTYSLDVSSLLEEGRLGFGDFALPCFMLTKQLRKPPQQIAIEMSEKLKLKNFSLKPTGPYLNFHIRWDILGKPLLAAAGSKYGNRKSVGKKAVVDYSHPNPAHPFHMGTVRTTIIGEAMCRILENQGWKVTRLCYVNDLGRQAMVALLGYLTYANGQTPDSKPDVWLGQIYFKMNTAIEETADLEAQLEGLLRRCEKGEKEITTISKRLTEWCYSGFKENYRLLGVKFDHYVRESQFVKDGMTDVQKLREKGLTFDAEGATVLNIEPYGLPNTIILRSDGTGLYLTRDIPQAIWREKQFKPDMNIYVVGEDQKLYFQQVFKTLELLDHKELAARSHHLAYSMVLLEGKKMSARRGWQVLWDELLEEGVKKAREEVAKRWPELSDNEKDRRARSIALAAISYFIVKYAPEKTINFSWDNALAFEGDTGPYLQYTHARAVSILKKAKVKRVGKFDSKLLTDQKEVAVLKLLSQYPSTLTKAARYLRPHYLAGYLFNLADTFNQFYQALPVIRADKPLRAARLKLVEAVATVLKSGMELLAISAPDKM